MKLLKDSQKSPLFTDVQLTSRSHLLQANVKNPSSLHEAAGAHDNYALVKAARKKPNISSAPSSPQPRTRPLDTMGVMTCRRTRSISTGSGSNSETVRSRFHKAAPSSFTSSMSTTTVIENEQAMPTTNERCCGNSDDSTYNLPSDSTSSYTLSGDRMERARRGVVISLGVDQLRYTVIVPGDCEKKWCIRSFGSIFRHLHEVWGRFTVVDCLIHRVLWWKYILINIKSMNVMEIIVLVINS